MKLIQLGLLYFFEGSGLGWTLDAFTGTVFFIGLLLVIKTTIKHTIISLSYCNQIYWEHQPQFKYTISLRPNSSMEAYSDLSTLLFPLCTLSTSRGQHWLQWGNLSNGKNNSLVLRVYLSSTANQTCPSCCSCSSADNWKKCNGCRCFSPFITF